MWSENTARKAEKVYYKIYKRVQMAAIIGPAAAWRSPGDGSPHKRRPAISDLIKLRVFAGHNNPRT